MLTLTIAASAGAPERTVTFAAESLRGEGVTIGRASRGGLVLEHPTVSRTHARLQLQGTVVRVLDLGSSGGTTVQGLRLAKDQPRDLADGDGFVIGVFTLGVRLIAADPQLLAATQIAEPGPERYMPLATIPVSGLPRWAGETVTVRCTRIVDETPDVKTFGFSAEPPLLFTYQPGQFATLDLIIDGRPVKRSYSISSSPARPHLLTITVKRVAAADGQPPGLVSNWLHANLAEGDTLNVSGPYGDFSCAKHPASRLLFISAGSGITPMLSMSRWLHDTAAAVDVVFVHTARSPRDLICQHELELIARENPAFRLVFSVSRPERGSAWSGLIGRLGIDALKLAVPDLYQRRVFTCGPDGFMRGVKEMLQQDGFPLTAYHEESFGGARKRPAATPATSPPYGLKALLQGISAPGPAAAPVQPQSSAKPGTSAHPAPPAAGALPATAVRFCLSNKTVPYQAGDSILETAEAHDVAIPSACRMGKCGTCRTVRRSGEIERAGYDDGILSGTDRAAGFILTCIARPKGPVEIGA